MKEFDQVIIDVKDKCSQLLSSPKHRINKLKNRLQYHTRNNHNQATLAFLLARTNASKLSKLPMV